MKTTVTETIGKDGKVIKRVTVTEDEGYPVMPIYPAPFVPLPCYTPQPPSTVPLPYTPHPWTITC